MNIPVGMNYQQTRQYLQRQIQMGRYMILGTVIITVVNLVFLLLNFDFYVSYCAAAAYYVTCLGKLMDNSWFSVLGPNGVYTHTGLAMAVAILGLLMAMWVLAKKDRRWILAAMAMLTADMAVLVLVAVSFLQGGILGVVWELVIHIAVIWEMGKSVSAQKMLLQVEAREEARLRELAMEAEALEQQEEEEPTPEYL